MIVASLATKDRPIGQAAVRLEDFTTAVIVVVVLI